MWKEDERFTVTDEAGATAILVKMVEEAAEVKRLVGLRRSIPLASFHFLLDGSNVSALPDGTFRNDETGQLLRRV